MADSVRFEHFEVLRREDGSLWELGRGAMGITYKAFDTNLRCHVALKVINSTFLASETARQRFLREARSAAAIRHPNVATVFHLGSDDETYFYAMEFIDGETVEDCLKRNGAFPTLEALEIVRQVARALAAASKQGLVHRDIKPANLMLVNEGGELLVKVIDFGLAKAVAAEGGADIATLTQGGFLGTPHFASPEQLEERELDIRSDIYSLGVTLYYMLAGRTPFSGSLAQVMSQHLYRVPPLSVFNDQPEIVVTLLERMLEKDPDKRPQTPADLKREVESCMAAVHAAGGGSRGGAEAKDSEQMETEVDELPREDSEEPGPGVVLADRFELLEAFQPGEYGETYRAKNLETGEIVAVLILDPKLVPTSEAYTRLENEVTALQRVRHPAIIRIDSLEHVHPLSWVTREWVEGPSLLDRLRERGPMTPAESLPILTSLAGGLDEVQHAGLPCPVLACAWISLVRREGISESQAKFNPLDFSGVMPSNPDATIVESHAAEGLSSARDRTDFARALAAIAYEMLGGLRSSNADESFVPVASLSEEANRVLRTALNPSQGYVSAVSFIARFAESVGDSLGVVRAPAPSEVVIQAPTAQTPPIERRSLNRAPRRSPITAVLLTFAALGGIAAVAWLVTNQGPGSNTATKTVSTPSVPTPDPSASPMALVEAIPLPSPTASPSPEPPVGNALVENILRSAKEKVASGEFFKALNLLAGAARDQADPAYVDELDRIIAGLRKEQNTNPEMVATLQEVLVEAAQAGSVQAQLYLAESDLEENLKWAIAASARGSGEGLRLQGIAYDMGIGVDPDPHHALELFQKAADLEDPEALFKVGQFHAFGRGGAEQDVNRQHHFYTRAAAYDHPGALAELGSMYLNGIGIESPDPVEAVRLFERAMEKGSANAHAYMGAMHGNGQITDGVAVLERREPDDVDLKTAVALFKKSAEMGSPIGTRSLAQAFLFGEGVEADPDQSKALYQKAAALGDLAAQHWCKKNNIDWRSVASSRE